jgi:hypothetical protein
MSVETLEPNIALALGYGDSREGFGIKSDSEFGVSKRIHDLTTQGSSMVDIARSIQELAAETLVSRPFPLDRTAIDTLTSWQDDQVALSITQTLAESLGLDVTQ